MTQIYSTKLFSEVFETLNDFVDMYDNYCTQINKQIFKDHNTVNVLGTLLYGRYASTPILNKSDDQFKYKLMNIIFCYGPTWEKRLEIQDKLRSLTEDDIRAGTKSVHNTALNPTQLASTDTLDEVNEITSQVAQKYQKNKAEAYAQLYAIIETDVTAQFLDKFNVLFKKFVMPERPLLYELPDDEE